MGFPSTGTVPVPSLNPKLAGIVAAARTDPDGVRDELVGGLSGGDARFGHLCANAWVFDPTFTMVLLVDHPRFSWTMPGGHLDPSEAPADAARRELAEETGLDVPLALDAPVAVVATEIPARGNHRTHMHYCLSYAFIAEPAVELSAEDGQPAAWFPVHVPLPEGFFGDNWRAADLAAALR